jgi:ribose 5-phosphate isomerase B
MKLYIASDHGGYYLKEELESYLEKKGVEVVDFGNLAYDPKDDYVDFVIPLAEKVSGGRDVLGVVLGRSGVGEAICANKVKGVYASNCTNVRMARRAREHNGANVLAMGAEYVTGGLAKRMVEAFLKTSFSSSTRHKRRVEKIKKYESSKIR